MAAIDKIYTNSYKEYKKVIEWLNNSNFIKNYMNNKCYNYVYKWNKENFSHKIELPIMITTRKIDYYLIKLCPIKIVQDRMKKVYNEKLINDVKDNKINELEFYYN